MKNLEDFEEAIKDLNENDMVIFDVDNTLILPKDLILRSENQPILSKLSEKYLANSDIIGPDKWDRNFLSSKTLLHAESMVVDPKIPLLIKNLQSKGIKTIALTAMQTGSHGLIESMEDWRIGQLKLHGIDFSSTFPDLKFLAFEQISRENSHPTFKSGVLCSGSHTKGEVLIAFLIHLNWKPKRIFMVDDKLEYLEIVRSDLETIEVEFRGFHYTAAQNINVRVDEKIAELQFKYLAEHGEWLSDNQAKNPLPDRIHKKEKMIAIKGAEIFCKIVGSGPTIICLHGGPGLDHSYFLPQMEEFATNHQLVFIDQRGSGRSTGTLNPETINIDQFIEDLEDVRRALGYKKIILLGHSWGALVATKYAKKFPERVASLLLLNSLPASHEGMQAFGDEVNKRKVTIAESLKQIEDNPEFENGNPQLVSEWYKTLFSIYCCDHKDSEKLNFDFTRKSIVKERKIQDIIFDNFLSTPFDLYPEFQGILCPTLIVHGECDPIRLEDSEKLNQTIKSSKIEKLKSGHFPFVETPKELFTILQNFLTSLNNQEKIK